MVKKYIVLLMVLLVCFGCTGCIEPVEKNENPGDTPLAEQDSQLGIINPVKELSRRELIEAAGIDLGAPEGAEDMAYSLITLSEHSPVAQLKFTLDGHQLCLRAQVIAEEIAIDISGMYYEWELTENVFVDRDYAVVNLADDVGYIKWVDMAPGIQYSLSMAEGADKDTLIDLAERVFKALQGSVG